MTGTVPPVGIELAQPLWLLALPVLAATLVAARWPWWRAARAVRERRPRRQQLRAEGRRLALRLGWLSLLVLALAEPSLARRLDRQAIVFVVDASTSLAPARDQVEALVRAALARLPAGDRAGAVAVAAEARVEEPPAERPSFARLGAAIAADATDLAAGLRLAGALLPEGYRGRVVLVSDGRQTTGDAVAAARELAARGAAVDVLPVGASPGPDVRLEAVNLPERGHRGEVATLLARVHADQPVGATVRVYRDDRLVLERAAALRAGRQEVALALPVGEPGMHRYRVDVAVADPALDALAANDALGAVQRVVGPPRVLIVARDRDAAGLLPEALGASGAEVVVQPPASLPTDLAGWAQYDLVALADLPAEALPPGAMELLEAAVRDLGRGLVMTGGPESFGPGGYAGTPVERALPVYMDLRGKGREPRASLMLVVDKSGSMSGLKMELAKEAAVRSVRLLRPDDQAGVLAFDAVPQWVAPLTPAAELPRLEAAIGSIYAGGGTEIYPALAAAFAALRGAPGEVKHVILLTDGQSGSSGDYGALLREMRGASVTVSTVAVGEDADRGLLQTIARAGRGRYHLADDPAAVPEIFVRETVMATRTILVDAPFVPAAAGPSPLLRGLAAPPRLDGYVATTVKERAEAVLVSPAGDPVLAAWQYGSGRAIAWTPDLAGRWSGAWAAGPAATTLWGNAIAWAMPPPAAGDLTVRVDSAAAGGVLVEAESRDGWEQVRPTRATLLGPDGRRTDVPLAPAGPGRYRAQLGALPPGAYVAQVAQDGEGGPARRGEVGWVAPYPSEYRQSGVDEALLARVAAAGGGRVLADPAEAVARSGATVVARWPAAPLLLVLAALAWPLEIAARRLAVAGRPLRWPIRPPAPVAPDPGAAAAAPSARSGPPRPPATTERLLERKRALRERRRRVS